MNLLGKSLLDIKKLISSKKISSTEVYDYFLKRIKKYNPKLNAFLSFKNKPDITKSIDNALLGIPLGVKDNFCTLSSQKEKTTAASLVLDNHYSYYESTVTRRLKDNGGIVIGKTNMDAWAHGSSTETSDYGSTKNPWDMKRVPGGSSGGSAAAVSSYIVPATIGSDTGGSIRNPSSWCGVIGLKPSYGRVSRYGVIAMGSSFDCPGTLTMSVEDSAYLLKIISGKDKYDATTSYEKVPDYYSNLNSKKKYVIGISDEYFKDVDNEVKEKIINALKIFEKQGHKIKKIKLISPKLAVSIYTILQRAEVSSNLARYDGVRYGNNRTYFGDEAKRRIMFGSYTLSYGYYDAYYKKAQKARTLIIEDFKKAFSEVDLIISPTTPTTALKLGEFKKYPFFGEIMDILNEPASVAGIPAINIPVGLDSKGLPIGLQIIGKSYDEQSVLNLAYMFEKETDFFGVIKNGIKNYG